LVYKLNIYSDYNRPGKGRKTCNLQVTKSFTPFIPGARSFIRCTAYFGDIETALIGGSTHLALEFILDGSKYPKKRQRERPLREING
jgi:hypothetical protein